MPKLLNEYQILDAKMWNPIFKEGYKGDFLLLMRDKRGISPPLKKFKRIWLGQSGPIIAQERRRLLSSLISLPEGATMRHLLRRRRATLRRETLPSSSLSLAQSPFHSLSHFYISLFPPRFFSFFDPNRHSTIQAARESPSSTRRLFELRRCRTSWGELRVAWGTTVSGGDDMWKSRSRTALLCRRPATFTAVFGC